MSTRIAIASTISRPARLAACLAAALGLTLSAAQASDIQRAHGPIHPNRAASAFHLPLYLRGSAAKAHASTPNHPEALHVVTNCADDGSAGSLRGVIGAASTASGDIVDVSQLTCAAITLQGAIQVNQDSLYLKGPSPDSASPPLTIEANNSSAVFNHSGQGTLTILSLTVANGYFVSSSSPTGGCVYSAGSVYLANSVVSHCTLESSSSSIAANGAGVYARDNLTMVNSTITDSHVFALNGADAGGGGAFIGNYFAAYYSTISNNTANALGVGVGVAGGALTFGGADIQMSTISGNEAQVVGAIDLSGAAYAAIIDSTISGNSGSNGAGGIFTLSPLTLTNTTVAFNHSQFEIRGYSEGVYAEAPLTLHSSIIADNSGPNGPSDLGGSPGAVITNGSANNLITSSTLNVPLGTIIACPKLEPLADNGGSTRTHRLKPTSPAIDQGDPGILSTDQRGAPRVAGIAADIGSVEGQPGEPPDEHIFVSGFDGVCDQ